MDDSFLYARCAIVAAGRHRYEQVLSDHATFAGTWSTDGESLLYAAEQAWARRTGRDDCEWEYEDPVSVETGSNESGGWPKPDFNQAPFLVGLREENLSFVGKSNYDRFDIELSMEAAPRVRDETEALLREHGGLPPRQIYVELHFLPARDWDLNIIRRDWPMDMRRRDERDWQHVAPYHRQLAICVSRADTARWSGQDQERGLRGLVGYLLADDLHHTAPDHGAISVLRQWREEAIDLF
jgi:Protein of unknown function (DUF4240)